MRERRRPGSPVRPHRRDPRGDRAGHGAGRAPGPRRDVRPRPRPPRARARPVVVRRPRPARVPPGAPAGRARRPAPPPVRVGAGARHRRGRPLGRPRDPRDPRVPRPVPADRARCRGDDPSIGRARTGGIPAMPWISELERTGRVSRIDLARLDADETAAMLASITGEAPSAMVASRFHRRSDGNPFFIEELVLAETGQGGARLPSTLQEILATRLGALSEPARSVVGIVAAAGRRIDHDLLAQAADRPGRRRPRRRPPRCDREPDPGRRRRHRAGRGLRLPPRPARRGGVRRPAPRRAPAPPPGVRRGAGGATDAHRRAGGRALGRARAPLGPRARAGQRVHSLAGGGGRGRGDLRVRGEPPPVRARDRSVDVRAGSRGARRRRPGGDPAARGPDGAPRRPRWTVRRAPARGDRRGRRGRGSGPARGDARGARSRPVGQRRLRRVPGRVRAGGRGDARRAADRRAGARAVGLRADADAARPLAGVGRPVRGGDRDRPAGRCPRGGGPRAKHARPRHRRPGSMRGGDRVPRAGPRRSRGRWATSTTSAGPT